MGHSGVSYGDYILSSLPAAYTTWPSLVYNLTPMSNTNLSGGSFSIPAAHTPSTSGGATPLATTYANSIGAIIYWPGTGPVRFLMR